MILPASVSIYLLYRRVGGVSLGGKMLGVALPVLLLILPKSPAVLTLSSKYTLDVMPWVIRMVSAFSLGLLFLLPLEFYAAALALVLITVFRTLKRETLVAYGLMLIVAAGLPSWSIYPLLISTLGFLLLLLSSRI